MEGNNGRLPEVTVDSPVVAPATGGAAVREVKQAGKEPTTPGSPSPATVRRGSGGGRADGGAALPGWKLECLCGESGLPLAVKGGFLCF
uniref:Uncharacterized protein n=1 Tax=Arundo donax TaxID=35708 RepID=A0A0A8ZXH1_ARUDO